MTAEDRGAHRDRHAVGSEPPAGPRGASNGERTSFGLRARLVVAFVGLAVASIVVLAVAVLLSGRAELASAEQVRQQLTAERVADLLRDAQDADGFDAAVVMSALALATADGAAVQLLDRDGDPVELDLAAVMGHMPADGDGGTDAGSMGAGPEGMSDGHMDDGRMGDRHRDGGQMGPADDVSPRAPTEPPASMDEHRGMMDRMFTTPADPGGPAVRADVAGDGGEIAEVVLTFPASRAAPEQQLATGVSRNVWLAAALIAILAAGLAVVLSRQLIRPVAALSDTVERIASGDRHVRTGARDAPGELGALAASVDRMADALDTQEQLRRELVANVAHELRTPLAVALGESEAMLDGVRPMTREQVASIRDEVATLARLVGDLESLAAAQAAVLSLDTERIDLADLVDERLARARDRLEVADRVLDLHVEGDCTVVGDVHRLGQVLDNLLRNAIAYTAPTGRIDVSVRRIADAVHITVSDDGPGIAPDERTRIFHRFARGSAASGVPGSGLGLAIVDELVRAHGGRIEALEPVAGQGAHLRVTFPART